jgi:hypothetical protein
MNNPETVRLAAYQQMVDAYRNESDRAAAILASSFVDNTLGRVLLAHMVDHPKVSDLFEGDRPLATFSSRITIAFGLGLLPPDRYSDLDLVRKIRNHFAHSEEAASFSASPVRDWCAGLWVGKWQTDEEFIARGITWDNRGQFLLTVGITTLYLDHLLVGFRNGTFKRCAVPGLAGDGDVPAHGITFAQ